MANIANLDIFCLLLAVASSSEGFRSDFFVGSGVLLSGVFVGSGVLLSGFFADTGVLLSGFFVDTDVLSSGFFADSVSNGVFLSVIFHSIIEF